MPISTDSQVQFAFIFEGTKNTFIHLSMEYFNSCAIAHNFCRQDLNYIQLSPRE